MAGSVTLQSNLISGQTGNKTIGPLIVSGVGNVIQVLDIPFASATFVSIQPPNGATACVITPPVGNLTSLTLKGITGDTGIALQPGQSILITFANPSSPASFGLTSGAAITGNVEVSFF